MAKRPDFKQKAATDPLLQFISAPREQGTATEQTAAEHTAADAEPTTTTEPPEGYKVNPLFVEKKTKRAQIVLKPSLYDKAKEASQAAGLSFNDYVCKAIEAYLNR